MTTQHEIVRTALGYHGTCNGHTAWMVLSAVTTHANVVTEPGYYLVPIGSMPCAAGATADLTGWSSLVSDQATRSAL